MYTGVYMWLLERRGLSNPHHNGNSHHVTCTSLYELWPTHKSLYSFIEYKAWSQKSHYWGQTLSPLYLTFGIGPKAPWKSIISLARQD